MTPLSVTKAILLLPGSMLVAVPASILLASRDVRVGWGLPPAWAWTLSAIGGLAIVGGLALIGRTARLFFTVGQGTPAPWEPPRRLVMAGPYRRCRNPMLTGASIVLAGESLLLGSVWLAGWFALFVAGNHFYFMLHEERVLARRFGDDYALYRRHVPRWLPRLKPWTPPSAPPPGSLK
ncbi:MAG: hypothetical protein BIFFINMI_01148 [Phycisphaerae bacterium]|nr:hypothetical protein [Phycisphaerae bacterium]